MSELDRRDVIREIAPYAQSSTAYGLALFVYDFGLYWAAIVGALLLPSIWLQIAASIFAGVKIGNLLTIAHDAAHGSLVKGKRLNWLLGVLAFLPCLYSYRMWVFDHHILHHARTNNDHKDTYTPFSKDQFDALPKWRQLLERFYRRANPVSFGVYYIVERWSKAKLFPHSKLPRSMRPSAWLHFVFVATFTATYVVVLLLAPMYSNNGPLMALFLGLFLPFFTFMALASFILWGMHTHPDVGWYRNDEPDSDLKKAGELVSVQMVFPRWISWLLHDVMDHPVHHLYPAIPCYRLHDAQARYNVLLGERAVVAKATPANVMDTMRRCKLYDFDNDRWLDFDGRPTSGLTKPYRYMKPAAAHVPKSAGS